MRKVNSLTFNWHQAGSTQDRDGAGECWERHTVGVNGCAEIEENEPANGWPLNYLIKFNNSREDVRIFNPNHVEYRTTVS